MKNFLSLVSFFVLLPYTYNNTNISCENRPLSLKKEAKQGFVLESSHYNYVAEKSSTGYFTYNLNTYSTPFTDVSKLFLLEFDVIFTSGKIATDNDEKGYDNKYDLYKGYVHRKVLSKKEDISRSSVTLLATWPKSDKGIVHFTSSYGLNLNMSSEFQTELNLTDFVSIKQTNSTTMSLNFEQSTTTIYSEPQLSNQISSEDSKVHQWNYTFAGFPNVSYHLTTYMLLEVKNDGHQGAYCFAHSFDVKMNNVAWRGYLWEQIGTTSRENEYLHIHFN